MSHGERKWMRTALAGVIVSMLALGAGPAIAADDDEDTFDTKFMKNVLSGLGLKQDNSDGIDYHERSPLVVPPTRDLRPPQSAATITSDPAWPKDRDVARRKTPKKSSTVMTEEEDMRQLSPSELRGGTAGRRAPNSEAAGVQGARPEQAMPSQLGHTGFTFGSVFGNKDGRVVQFTGEPPRTSLVEPPVGLRTPSNKYPYGSTGVLEAEKNGPRDQASYGTNR